MLVLTLIAFAAPSIAGGATSAAQRARDLLRGHLFERFTETGVLGDTLDQRLHLCSDGRFVYDSSSYLPDTGTTTDERTTGRWRVVWAHFGHHSASAQVRGVPDRGGPAIRVTISIDRRGQVRVDGLLVIVSRSEECR
jgi:hypothetical protein